MIPAGRTVLTLMLLAPLPAGAQSRDWMLGPFVKPAGINPLIAPTAASTFVSPMNDSTVRWEEYATFNPAAAVKDGRVHLLYRAEDASGAMQIGGHTSRLGLAVSADGLHFTRRGTPVLFPAKDAQRGNEWPGGVEDPRIVETEDGTYVLTYTQWNRDVPRLAVATSRDLVTWAKHGPAFARAHGGKYLATESKSGAILTRAVGNRLIATKVNGTYWMYYGVPDIHIATSDNLIDWTPLEDENARPLNVLSPRPGYFDSWLVEAGPPAVLTEHGVVVLYNAGNSGVAGDATLPTRVYTGGQALFDRRNPVRLLDRAERPFIQPTEPWERTGQYKEGTTFIEGLVPLDGRWLLYYGTADSRVAVAVWATRSPANGTSAPGAPGSQWTKERARAWADSVGWMVGANFTPSTAINQLEMWQASTFDPATIDRELGWAASIGFNTARVFLHDLLWQQDSTGFLDRMEQFLRIADRHHIRPMFVLFDAVWDPQPRLGPQRQPVPHLHNSGWVQSPGAAILRDTARLDELRPYVQGVIRRFGRDRRVLAWDLFNEPDNVNRPAYIAYEPLNKEAAAFALLRKAFAWAREVDPAQPLTAGPWKGDWLDASSQAPITAFMIEQSDVISFHSYDDSTRVERLVIALERQGRPILCTEYMARPRGSTFRHILPVLQRHGVGAFNWGLVFGKTQTIYPWDSWTREYIAEPAVWFHDIFRPDGTPFDEREVVFLRSLTGRH